MSKPKHKGDRFNWNPQVPKRRYFAVAYTDGVGITPEGGRETIVSLPLAAAAPELLEALRALMSCGPGAKAWAQAYEVAEAAIRRATGEE